MLNTIQVVIFKGGIFHEWDLIFHFKNFNFTNGSWGPILAKYYISRIEPVPAKFLKIKSLENFHLYGIQKLAQNMYTTKKLLTLCKSPCPHELEEGTRLQGWSERPPAP